MFVKRILAMLLVATLLAASGCGSTPGGTYLEIDYVPTIAPTDNIPTPSPTPATILADPDPDPATPDSTLTPTGSPEPSIVPDGIADDVLPPLRTYDEYKAENSDVIGWLKVEGTNIDYPVVRGTDNEYYRSHTVEKAQSKHGAIFMDFRNADEDQRKHLLIYGHNMSNGTMFHDLNNYKQPSFFEKNKIITFEWNGKETQWQVYVAYVWTSGQVYFHHTRFGNDKNFAKVMNDLTEYAKTVKTSVVDSSVTIQPTDQVLTLSTCTYEYDNSRLVVSARRIK